MVEFVFDLEENKDDINELKFFMRENRGKKGLLMDALHKAQGLFGYLPIEIQRIVSEELRVSLAEIYGVATFYSHFSLIPKGEYNVGVCMGTACYVKQAQKILDKVEESLGIEVGQTTPDRKFSISATRCLGACGLAPVMMIGDDVYGRLVEDDIEGILNKYR
ncbi:MAG: NAD(P)H-dependent oxidoreductase subunit E [Tissierellia bacterium]|nr:NAD(P)H-dependent oxidoreductase subunit E [Tissierellia bacterium]